MCIWQRHPGRKALSNLQRLERDAASLHDLLTGRESFTPLREGDVFDGTNLYALCGKDMELLTLLASDTVAPFVASSVEMRMLLQHAFVHGFTLQARGGARVNDGRTSICWRMIEIGTRRTRQTESSTDSILKPGCPKWEHAVFVETLCRELIKAWDATAHPYPAAKDFADDCTRFVTAYVGHAGQSNRRKRDLAEALKWQIRETIASASDPAPRAGMGARRTFGEGEEDPAKQAERIWHRHHVVALLADKAPNLDEGGDAVNRRASLVRELVALQRKVGKPWAEAHWDLLAGSERETVMKAAAASDVASRWTSKEWSEKGERFMGALAQLVVTTAPRAVEVLEPVLNKTHMQWLAAQASDPAEHLRFYADVLRQGGILHGVRALDSVAGALQSGVIAVDLQQRDSALRFLAFMHEFDPELAAIYKRFERQPDRLEQPLQNLVHRSIGADVAAPSVGLPDMNLLHHVLSEDHLAWLEGRELDLVQHLNFYARVVGVSAPRAGREKMLAGVVDALHASVVDSDLSEQNRVLEFLRSVQDFSSELFPLYRRFNAQPERLSPALRKLFQARAVPGSDGPSPAQIACILLDESHLSWLERNGYDIGATIERYAQKLGAAAEDSGEIRELKRIVASDEPTVLKQARLLSRLQDGWENGNVPPLVPIVESSVLKEHIPVLRNVLEQDDHSIEIETLASRFADFAPAGIAPTKNLLLELVNNDSPQALIEQWIHEIDRICAEGIFDPRNVLHQQLGYTLYLATLEEMPFLRGEMLPYASYLELLRRELSGAARVADPGQYNQRDQAEICFLALEAAYLMDFITSLAHSAARVGRGILVVENLSYGGVALAPIRPALKDAAIPAISAKVGSTEAHDNRGVLNPKLFSERALRSLIEDQPVVVVVDGSSSVGGVFTTARYPDAYQGYRNYFMAINEALGLPYDPYADFSADGAAVDAVRSNPAFRELVGNIRSLGAVPENPVPFRMHFWSPATVPLQINERKGGRRVVPTALAPERISGPSLIVVQSSMTHFDITDRAQHDARAEWALRKAANLTVPGYKHVPCYPDDTARFTQLRIRLGPYGPHAVHDFDEAAQQAYAEMNAFRQRRTTRPN